MQFLVLVALALCRRLWRLGCRWRRWVGCLRRLLARMLVRRRSRHSQRLLVQALVLLAPGLSRRLCLLVRWLREHAAWLEARPNARQFGPATRALAEILRGDVGLGAMEEDDARTALNWLYAVRHHAELRLAQAFKTAGV